MHGFYSSIKNDFFILELYLISFKIPLWFKLGTFFVSGPVSSTFRSQLLPSGAQEKKSPPTISALLNHYVEAVDPRSRSTRLPYKRYSEEAMVKAVDLVHQGYSTPLAASACGIPERSLYNNLAKCPDHKGKCRGALTSPDPTFNAQQNDQQNHQSFS
jgi:hypothetical protein